MGTGTLGLVQISQVFTWVPALWEKSANVGKKAAFWTCNIFRCFHMDTGTLGLVKISQVFTWVPALWEKSANVGEKPPFGLVIFSDVFT